MGDKRMHSVLRFMGLLALCCAVGLGAGCARFSTPVLPFFGSTFNATTAPVDIHFNRTRIGPAEGRSKASSVLGVVAWGSCSVQRAAMNGELETVDQIDCSIRNYFMVLTTYEIIATGRPRPVVPGGAWVIEE